MKKKHQNYDTQFVDFANSISRKLAENAKIPEDQEAQVNKVFELETKFVKSLTSLAPSKLTDTYMKFILYIKNEVGNLLTSQSYFRVKKASFNKVSKHIKNNEASKLVEFPINYNLATFIRDNWGSPLPAKAEEIFQQLVGARHLLIENNIPLAINRAKLFYRKTKEHNLTLMDLINICLVGLVVGIDKYSGPYTRSWRSTCIGRMTGFMIKEYSETFIKLFPSDRKILYRANMIKYRNKIEDINELTAAINASFEDDKKQGMAIPKLPISVETVENLINSAHYYSTDSQEPDAEYSETVSDESVGGWAGRSLDQYESSLYGGEEPVSEKLERYDISYQLNLAIKKLDIIQQKVLRLKGVNQ